MVMLIHSTAAGLRSVLRSVLVVSGLTMVSVVSACGSESGNEKLDSAAFVAAVQALCDEQEALEESFPDTSGMSDKDRTKTQVEFARKNQDIGQRLLTLRPIEKVDQDFLGELRKANDDLLRAAQASDENEMRQVNKRINTMVEERGEGFACLSN
jgi:hypothetical protein